MWESPWAHMKLRLWESMDSWGGQREQEVGDGRDGEGAEQPQSR